MSAQLTPPDHLISERDNAVVAWQIDADELASLLGEVADADARLHGLGRRFDDTVIEAAAAQLGCDVADDPADATHIVVADTPRSLEERLEAMRLHLDANRRVFCVDYSLANWPSFARHGRVWEYRPGDTDTWGRFLESHLVAIFNRELDGFIVARFNAYVDLGDVEFVVSDEIKNFITCHYLETPMLAGQRRQVDIELHPGAVPKRGQTGTISVRSNGVDIGISQTFTVATARFIQCVLSGRDEGPISGDKLDRLVKRLHRGTMPSLMAARRIQRESKRTGIEP